MISAGGHNQPNVRPRTGVRLLLGSRRWVLAGRWPMRNALMLGLALMLKDQAPGPGDVACLFGSETQPSVIYVSGTSSVAQLVATRPVMISGGELDLSTKSLVSEATNLTLAGGAIGGQGQLILHGQTEWTAGAVVGEGDTTIPAGSALSLNDGGCCNALVGEHHSLTVGGTLAAIENSILKIDETAHLSFVPGAVFKGGHGSSLRIDSEASLTAKGLEGNPVTFASLHDDSVGPNLNPTHTAPAPGDWTGISFSDAKSVSLNYVDFRYAVSAVSLEFLDSASISHSDFVYNDAAISVGGTADNDPILAALPCVPPYLSFVDGSSDWFGKDGLPAPDIDLASVVSAIIPGEYNSLFSAGASLAGNTDSSFGGDNTVPWSIYSCPVLAIPPIPVTPVILTESPSAPWFPDPEFSQ